MTWLSHQLDKSMLKKGDHIYSYRNAHLCFNHGIYVGGDRVIHYMSSSESNGGCGKCEYDPRNQGEVVKTCLDCFLQGHSLYRFEYNVSKAHYLAHRSGTCYTGSCDRPDVVVRRANKMLGNKNTDCIPSGTVNDFNLSDKKSVCFAVLCMTGNPDIVKEVAEKSRIKMTLEFASFLLSLYEMYKGETYFK